MAFKRRLIHLGKDEGWAKEKNPLELLILAIIAAIRRIFGAGNDDAGAGQAAEEVKDQSFKHPLVQKNFLSPREQTMSFVIQRVAAKTGLMPFAKVLLVDVVATDHKVQWKEREWQDKRFIQQHLDFAFLNLKKNKVVLAVEVDDKSHNSQRQQTRDEKKNTVLDIAGVPLYRVPQGWFEQESIEKELLEMI